MGRPAAIPGGDQRDRTEMQDFVWLAILGGLFALTLALVQLCDVA